MIIIIFVSNVIMTIKSVNIYEVLRRTFSTKILSKYLKLRASVYPKTPQRNEEDKLRVRKKKLYLT